MNNSEVDKVILDSQQILESKIKLFQSINQQINLNYSVMNNEQLQELKKDLNIYRDQLSGLSTQIDTIRDKILDFTGQYSKNKISSGSSIFERISRSQSYKDKQNQKTNTTTNLLSLNKELGDADREIIKKRSEIGIKMQEISNLLNPKPLNTLFQSSSISNAPSSSSSSSTKSYGYTQDQRRRFGGRYKKSKKSKKGKKTKKRYTKKQMIGRK